MGTLKVVLMLGLGVLAMSLGLGPAPLYADGCDPCDSFVPGVETALYHLDGADPGADSSGNGYHASVYSGAASGAACGEGLLLTGPCCAYLEVPDDSAFEQPLQTWEVLFSLPADSDGGILMNSEDRVGWRHRQISVIPGRRLEVSMEEDLDADGAAGLSFVSTHALATDVWVVVTAVFDDFERRVTVYQDGCELTDLAHLTMGATAPRQTITIGQGNETRLESYQFDGTIDEVRILEGRHVPAGCAPPAIASAHAVKNPADVSDVLLEWMTLTPGGYNVWSVAAKADIPEAHAPERPGVESVCAGRTVPSCSHASGVSGIPGSIRFYQIRGRCGDLEGP